MHVREENMWWAYLLFHGCFTLMSDVTVDRVEVVRKMKDNKGKRAYLLWDSVVWSEIVQTQQLRHG